VSLAFDRAGSGPPLVLIHGLGHRRQAWDPVLDRLTPHREVITLDLPGHGASPPLRADGRNAIAAMADSIGDLLTSLGLDRPHVAGNSLGGELALVLAARGRAASATALSPAGFPNRRYQDSYAKVFFEVAVASAKLLTPAIPTLARRPAFRAAMFGMVVARPSRLSEAQARGDMAAIAQSRDAIRAVFANFDMFTDVIPDGVPVTIAWGSKDRILPLANAVVARRQLPQARFLSLPGCGHVPMSDDPELVARVLLEGSG
jgi:pimeloyl-ACP methyl ester carboxylesterase